MITMAAWALTTLAGLLAAMTFVFVVEIATSLFSTAYIRTRSQASGAVAVLVPARDEAAGIAQTLNSIKAQLRVGDRLVVVADNCSDNTAEIVIRMGAEVSVRSDTSRVGKGYALDWGSTSTMIPRYDHRD